MAGLFGLVLVQTYPSVALVSTPFLGHALLTYPQPCPMCPYSKRVCRVSRRRDMRFFKIAVRLGPETLTTPFCTVPKITRGAKRWTDLLACGRWV